MQKALYIILTIIVMAGSSVRAQIDTDRMTVIGRNALYFEDYILAIQYFNQIIKAKPYLAKPYYFRAVGKYHLEDYKGALSDCDEALEHNPYLLDAYNLRGILCQKMEDPEASIKDYKRGLEIDPLNLNLLINLGIAYIQTEQYNQAIEIYSEVLNQSPHLISGYLNRGLAKFSAEDTTGALKDFSKAVETNPYIPDGYVNRAMVYYHQGSFEKALDDVESAIRLRPDEGSLYMNRGIIRYQLDDLKGTMRDFNKFTDLEPRNALGYNNRGILRAEIGDLDGAINDLSRVLALREEEDLLTLYYRGMLYKEKGEFRKALSDFNVVAEAYPDFAPVYMNRAGVKQALGQDEAAQLDYNTAMKIEMDRRDKIGSSQKQVASSQGQLSDKDDKKSPRKRKETRKEGDKNIRNYNKIAVLDDFGADQPEQLTGTSLRGKIQNRNIMVDLQPSYGITFFPGDTLVHRVRYFERDVEKLDNLFISDRHIEIANATKEIDRAASTQLFETISQIDKKLSNALSPEKQKVYYMERALLYLAALNLNNAIDDFSKVIEFDPENYLAYFMRSYARCKMVETVRDMQSENPPAAEQLEIKQNLNGAGDETLNRQTILDYNLVIDDLRKTTDINPDFEFAWFNLGYINSLLRNFDEAVKYYSKAIELNSEFAEAYFNRGLVRIFLGETSEGTFDLSKSGELGVFEAYSVIKRYGSYSVESQNDEPGGRE
jgi:tetratricopeptide (TPR) repeat protein